MKISVEPPENKVAETTGEILEFTRIKCPLEAQLGFELT